MENKLILINQILVDLKELKDDLEAGNIMEDGIAGVLNAISNKVEEVKKGVEEEIADAEAKQKEAEEAEKAN